MSVKEFRSLWIEEAAPSGSYRSIFKLGKPNDFKHPSDALVRLVKEEFGLKDSDFAARRLEGLERVKLEQRPSLSETQVARFKEIVGEENVSASDYDRARYSSGQTLKEVLELRQQRVSHPTDLVVHPRNKEDVRQVVAYCNAEKIPVVAFGGGSSVVRGLTPAKGGVTLVMGTHMNKVLAINELNQTATVQPGMMGPDYEEVLNEAPTRFGTRRPYTCGHFPQSFELSTVGGWVVTLGSGQASTYYGDAYHLVIGQEYVTPAGSFKTLNYPATATGPKVNDIMKGSEGSFGILVELTMKIYRYMPENRQRFAFIFPSWEAAVDASREIMQGEFGLPAIYRISDPEETDRGMKMFGMNSSLVETVMGVRKFKPMERCLCVGTVEGEAGYARHVKRQIKKVAGQHGAMYVSELPTKMWEKTRYREALMREDWMDYGIVIDTLEAAVTWDNLHNLHQAVRAFVKARPQTICMTHASHFYPNGTNLYFIFMMRPENADEYTTFHKGVIEAIVRNGGSLSHHHGVGRLFAPWMEAHLGHEQLEVLRALKRHFDPNNIMNPGGQLGLDSIANPGGQLGLDNIANPGGQLGKERLPTDHREGEP